MTNDDDDDEEEEEEGQEAELVMMKMMMIIRRKRRERRIKDYRYCHLQQLMVSVNKIKVKLMRFQLCQT